MSSSTGKNTLGLTKRFSCIGTAIQENNLYWGGGERFLTTLDLVLGEYKKNASKVQFVHFSHGLARATFGFGASGAFSCLDRQTRERWSWQITKFYLQSSALDRRFSHYMKVRVYAQAQYLRIEPQNCVHLFQEQTKKSLMYQRCDA